MLEKNSYKIILSSKNAKNDLKKNVPCSCSTLKKINAPTAGLVSELFCIPNTQKQRKTH